MRPTLPAALEIGNVVLIEEKLVLFTEKFVRAIARSTPPVGKLAVERRNAASHSRKTILRAATSAFDLESPIKTRKAHTVSRKAHTVRCKAAPKIENVIPTVQNERPPLAKLV